jgi:hypothetical protein
MDCICVRSEFICYIRVWECPVSQREEKRRSGHTWWVLVAVASQGPGEDVA